MRIVKHPIRVHSARELVGMGLVLGTLALGVSLSGWLTRMDHFVFDLAQRLAVQPAPSGVVLVAIDQASLQELGRWPWTRHVHAELLQRICRAAPKAVAMDIAFNEVGDDPAANQSLAHAMQDCGKVALPVVMESARQGGQLLESPPIALLTQSAAGLGRVSVRLDNDGVARGVDLWEGVGTPAWPLLAQTVLQISGWQPPAGAAHLLPPDVEERPHAMVRREPRLLRFAGPAGTVPSVSASELMRSPVPAEALRGKIVLVGATAAGLGDLLPTPVSTHGAAMPGVEILATALLNLRDDRFIVPLGTAWALALTLVLALVPLLWAIRLMPLSGLLVSAVWFVAVAAFSMTLPMMFGHWFAPSGALVAAISAYPLWSWRRLEAARRHLDWQLRQLTGMTGESSLRRLGFEQRISHVQQAQERFHDLQKQREETLNFLTHDIRAPLAAAVQRLGSGTLDEAGQHSLFRQLRRAHRLAQAFLSLARVQSLEPKDLREIDLGAVLHQAADAVYESARARSVRVVRHIPDEPVWIRGDFDLLERALGNLLHNALRFAPASSAITVALTLNHGYAELSVADQGPGVSEEMLSRLFERFSPQTPERDEHSIGLGLHFVHTVTNRHGGQAAYQALTPTGASFSMRIPLADSNTAGD